MLSVCEKSYVWCFTQNPRNTQNAMRSKFSEILCYLCVKNLVCGVSHRIHGTHRMPCRVISVKFCALCAKNLLCGVSHRIHGIHRMPCGVNFCEILCCVRKLLSLVFHTETTEHTEYHADKFCVILCYLCAKNLLCGVSHRIHGTHRMPCRVISVKFCAICVRIILCVVFHTEIHGTHRIPCG